MFGLSNLALRKVNKSVVQTQSERTAKFKSTGQKPATQRYGGRTNQTMFMSLFRPSEMPGSTHPKTKQMHQNISASIAIGLHCKHGAGISHMFYCSSVEEKLMICYGNCASPILRAFTIEIITFCPMRVLSRLASL